MYIVYTLCVWKRAFSGPANWLELRYRNLSPLRHTHTRECGGQVCSYLITAQSLRVVYILQCNHCSNCSNCSNMGCWRHFGLLVLGCVLRTAGNSIIWYYADPLTSLNPELNKPRIKCEQHLASWNKHAIRLMKNIVVGGVITLNYKICKTWHYSWPGWGKNWVVLTK